MFGKRWNPEGLHVYITGGSQGLGLALAVILVERGANVSIVARNQDNLDKAVELLKTHRRSDSQNIHAYSFSLADGVQSTAALEAVCAPYHGKAPDALFLCAGSAHPGFFVEMTEQDLQGGMRDGYWVQAWTAWAVAKMIAKQKKKNAKIVFVSSTLGLMSFIGYAGYSPAKHAIRGLADTLRHELILYNTDVHTFFPTTMYTPGYENENKTKPKITKEIEEGDEGLTAEQAALALYKGVEKGHVHITGDFLTGLFRASTRGSAPRTNWIWEGLMDAVAYIAVPVWRYSIDKKVANHRMEHQDYLAQKGFFES